MQVTASPIFKRKYFGRWAEYSLIYLGICFDFHCMDLRWSCVKSKLFSDKSSDFTKKLSSTSHHQKSMLMFVDPKCVQFCKFITQDPSIVNQNKHRSRCSPPSFSISLWRKMSHQLFPAKNNRQNSAKWYMS